ncbi:MAG: hypothetical protein U0229_07245 [Anaeromyxobacter sp.]
MEARRSAGVAGRGWCCVTSSSQSSRDHASVPAAASQAAEAAILGVLAVAAGIAFLGRVASEVGGPAAGWVCGLGLALSPNALVAGVELRSYPLLLALSCVLFGVVAALAAFAALAPAAWADRAARRRWAIGASAVAAASVPLAPFALAALRLGPNAGAPGLESQAGAGEIAAGALRLGWRLLGGHAAGAAFFLPAALAVGATAALAALALAGTRAGSEARGAARGLALGLGAGLAVTFAARLVARSFDALVPSYAAWALPPVALLTGLAVAAAGRARTAALALGAVLVAGQGAAAATLLAWHEVFAWAPSGRLAAEVAAAGGPEGVLVVHDGDVRHALWPLRVLAPPALRQEPIDALRAQPERLEGTRRVLLVTTRALDAAALGALVRGAAPPVLSAPETRRWLEARGFRGSGGRTLPGFRACEVERFERPAGVSAPR